MAKILSILSGKGGTGKSTISAALAVSLAARGHRVLVADLDIGLRSLDLLLGMENQVIFDLGDVLAKRCDLQAACVPHPKYPNLRLICPPASSGEEAVREIPGLLRRAGEGVDYLLLDLPAGLGFSVRIAQELSDLCIAVTTPDLVTVRDTRATLDLVLEAGPKPCRLVINKVNRAAMRTGGMADLDELMDRIGAPLLGVVPMDPYIASDGTLYPSEKRRGVQTQRILDAMAGRICGDYIPLILRSL